MLSPRRAFTRNSQYSILLMPISALCSIQELLADFLCVAALSIVTTCALLATRYQRVQQYRYFDNLSIKDSDAP